MELSDLILRFSDTRDHRVKAIFSTLFIAGNRLQTVFDGADSEITLKQFMLLTMIRQSEERLTFTELGKLLGCSRQNIKKLAAVLQQNGFVKIVQSEADGRALAVVPTERCQAYFERVAAHHRQELAILFGIYSDQEVEQLYHLLMKLYEGIENLEQKG